MNHSPKLVKKVYWVLIDFPKIFLGLWAHPIYGAGGPPNGVYGAPGPIEGVGPQTPNFFWEVYEVPIDFFSPV